MVLAILTVLRAVLKMSEQGFILETVLEKGVNVQ